jgi:hypothetical protein
MFIRKKLHSVSITHRRTIGFRRTIGGFRVIVLVYLFGFSVFILFGFVERMLNDTIPDAEV